MDGFREQFSVMIVPSGLQQHPENNRIESLLN
jgi:hypothetical protein